MIEKIHFGELLAGALALTGCVSRPPEPEPLTRQSSGTAAAEGAGLTPAAGSPTARKRIGDPCVSSDGWVEQGAAAVETTDAVPALEPSNGTPDRASTGTGYCLSPGPGYPYGYFTANCDADADCPTESFCEGANPSCPKGSDCRGQCRRPCTSDSECAAPMTCSVGTAPRKFCYQQWSAKF
jgi:hypothetical protein